MNLNLASSPEVDEPAARPRKPRGRAARGAKPHPRRAVQERPALADVDALYLADMAASHLLTAEQEVRLAQRIVGAERSLIEALVCAPSGSRALGGLGERLVAGSIDVRTLLLNPDQAGLDLPGAEDQLRAALGRSGATSVATRAAVIDTLAGLRLDTLVVDGVIAAIQGGASSSLDDAEAAMAIESARRELRREKERLVVGNLRLVVLFARRYLGRGVPLLDLVQEGNLGLMRAADKFDHTRGFRFSTYAVWWIKQAIQRALLDRTLRLPVHVADDRRRVAKVRASYLTQHLEEATTAEIARLSGLAPERVESILRLPGQPTSLDAPLGEEGDATLADLVASEHALPDAAAALRALGGHLEALLGMLTAREQRVLRMRFGIGGGHEHTLEEVGLALSLTRERIRQIEHAALDKLRARESRVELRSYLDR
jgi:RNA polymerase primary sigma factor